MTYKIIKLLFRILFFFGLPQKRCRDKITIIFYHGFTHKAADPRGLENRHGNQLELSKFERHLRYLTAHHNVLSLSRLLDHLERKEKPPENTVVVTLDDGFGSSYALAFPLLKKFGVPVDIFVTTNFIEGKEFLWPDRLEYVLTRAAPFSAEIGAGDQTVRISTETEEDRIKTDDRIRKLLKNMDQEKRPSVMEALEDKAGIKLGETRDVPAEYRPLTWGETREMTRSGLVAIGSHTRTHTILTRCGAERAREELETSKKIIEQKMERRCDTFAYPNGQAGDFSRRTGALLRKLGYRCGLTTVRGYNDVGSDVFELKRIPISNFHDRTGFLMALYCADGFRALLRRIFRGT